MSKAVKTEHGGAKNGGGYWGKRAEAKQRSKKLRRRAGKQLRPQQFSANQKISQRTPPAQS